MENCVYKFINKNKEIIYISNSQYLQQKLSNQSYCLEECYKELDYIECVKVNSLDEAKCLERYLILKYMPKFNKDSIDINIGFNIDIFDSLKWNKLNKDIAYELK